MKKNTLLVLARPRPASDRYDAIVLDLFEGPDEAGRRDAAIFGAAGLAATRRALQPGGSPGYRWSQKFREGIGATG